MTPERVQITAEVNGKSVDLGVRPSERLSKTLRTRLGLTGTKVGCDAGDCGACSILLDGSPVCSCMVASVQASGKSIITVEGLGGHDQEMQTSQPDRGTLDVLQQAFLRHGAAQCGICTPGMLICAKALLDQNKKPTTDEIREALGGVLCRCTGYSKIIAAVGDAARQNFPEHTEPYKKIGRQQKNAGAAKECTVGLPIPRLDGLEKITAVEKFGDDAVPAEALIAKIIRSPHHHAEFSFGDLESFRLTNPGVTAIFSADDIPGRNCFGVLPPFVDQPVFAENICRYRGEAVAMVIGPADEFDTVDWGTFPIVWTELSHNLSTIAATQSGMPELHESRSGNVLIEGLVECGSVADALQYSDKRVEDSFETSYVEHACIELEAGWAQSVDGIIEIHACTQAPHMDQEELANILGLPVKQIRVVPSAVGGGFGTKLDLSVQPYIALAAHKLKIPVRLAYTRQESMTSTTKRHPSNLKVEIGADSSGKLTAIKFDGIFNTGAYASWGPTVANRVPVHASGPYYVPNYKATATAVHTNGPVAGAFRGFGVPQSAIAVETLFDRLADITGVDRLEFRIKNALTNNLPTVTGQKFESGVGIKRCLEALKTNWERAKRESKRFNQNKSGEPNSGIRRGIGLASCWYGCGNTALPNPSTIKAGILKNGTPVIYQGAVDIGQGSNTVITQIFASALGLPVKSIKIITGNTEFTPDAGKTSASRQTFISGNAARLCGLALRQNILRQINVSDNATLELEGSQLTVIDEDIRHQIDLGNMSADEEGFVYCEEQTYDAPTTGLDEKGQGSPYAVFGYGAQLVELTVDPVLGKVRLEKVTAAHDVGRAINPQLVEGQIEGGIAQGIGMALMEEYVPGESENLHDYLIPTIGDIPEIESIIIEEHDPEGPFGAKGLGEHVLIPTAPAILNAIRDATGAAITKIPATPNRVREAIRKLEVEK